MSDLRLCCEHCDLDCVFNNEHEMACSPEVCGPVVTDELCPCGEGYLLDFGSRSPDLVCEDPDCSYDPFESGPISPLDEPAVEEQSVGVEADVDVNPGHYRSHPSGVEAIEITEHLPFCLGNAAKYLIRRQYKDSVVLNLKKSQWYLKREIARRLQEVWAEFPDDTRYEVSSAGRVKRKDTGRIRALQPLKNGYLTFLVADKSTPSGYKCYYVHRAVVTAFFGTIPENLQVCHNDGNRQNNHVSNLRVDTVKGNTRDKKKHGTEPSGERAHMAKLTAESVAEIRLSAESESTLAPIYGVSRSQIGRIKRGQNWGDTRTEEMKALETWLDAEPDARVREILTTITTQHQIESLTMAISLIQELIDEESTDVSR